MTYQHQYTDRTPINLTMGKVVCVGRNYAEHARELNNPVPSEPLLFIKPATAVVPLADGFQLPNGRGAVHYETEIALLIGAPLSGTVSPADAAGAIAGIGLALDLTLRELQDQLKAKGHPWARAKAFDGACPLSPFLPPDAVPALDSIGLQLRINGALRPDGSSAEMLTHIVTLLHHIAGIFTLLPGDVVRTGTPAGVGVLQPGDELALEIPGALQQSARVAGD